MADTGGVSVDVVIDNAALNRVLAGPNGPVARMLIRDAELVKTEAKRLVGVSTPQPGPPRARKHGQLRDSIVKRLVKTPTGIAALVGSSDRIALWHHEGTRPHVIRAVRKPRLVFYWPKVGRVVSFKQVNHPGTQPNRFLTNALRVIRRR